METGQEAVRLVENVPLDTDPIARLLSNPEDLYLVWPQANYPFNSDQWHGVLDPQQGHKSFLVYQGHRLIGHAALRKTETAQVYALSFLYLIPELRSRGIGAQLVDLLEQYARTRLAARKLVLKVRTYNSRAYKLYLRCGFQEDFRQGTLIRMSKKIRAD